MSEGWTLGLIVVPLLSLGAVALACWVAKESKQ